MPGKGELVLQVRACGICRTDLHLAWGELPNPKLPVVLGHEIVGTVVTRGADVEGFSEGDRVGVPWLGWTCGSCGYCLSGRENLCDRARFTDFMAMGVLRTIPSPTPDSVSPCQPHTTTCTPRRYSVPA